MLLGGPGSLLLKKLQPLPPAPSLWAHHDHPATQKESTPFPTMNSHPSSSQRLLGFLASVTASPLPQPHKHLSSTIAVNPVPWCPALTQVPEEEYPRDHRLLRIQISHCPAGYSYTSATNLIQLVPKYTDNFSL